MSQKSIESVIGKSILNDEFRQLLFEDPDKALAGFPLTLAEKTKLRIVDSETLETLAYTLDQRLGRLRLADKPDGHGRCSQETPIIGNHNSKRKKHENLPQK